MIPRNDLKGNNKVKYDMKHDDETPFCYHLTFHNHISCILNPLLIPTTGELHSDFGPILSLKIYPTTLSTSVLKLFKAFSQYIHKFLEK